jgi:hypothetical protein
MEPLNTGSCWSGIPVRRAERFLRLPPPPPPPPPAPVAALRHCPGTAATARAHGFDFANPPRSIRQCNPGLGVDERHRTSIDQESAAGPKRLHEGMPDVTKQYTITVPGPGGTQTATTTSP